MFSRKKNKSTNLERFSPRTSYSTHVGSSSLHTEGSNKKSLYMKIACFSIFVALLSANVLTFAQTVGISDEIVNLESKTLSLKKENAQLEQKMYTQNSMTNLEELAQQLGFTKPSEPLFLESNEYALVP